MSTLNLMAIKKRKLKTVNKHNSESSISSRRRAKGSNKLPKKVNKKTILKKNKAVKAVKKFFSKKKLKKAKSADNKPRVKAKIKKIAKKPLKHKKTVKTKIKKAVIKISKAAPVARKEEKKSKPFLKKSILSKKRIKEDAAVPFSAESFFKAKIKVVGVGGGGGSIVSEIGRSLEKATFVIADTDARALKKKTGIKYFCFGQNLTHGLGTGVNVDLARQAAEQDKDKISGIFKDQDIIIFIASLGGGLGSGATKVFAEAAKTFGGITLGIFTLPFKFEGKNKTRIALKALKDLRSSLNVSITIPNEKIFKIIGNNTPITQAFSIVNKSLIEGLESLIDIIYNPGLINIDFADLRSILRGRGNLAFLNTIESSGKNRAEDIAKTILVNPLYQNNNFVAENILFNISGGQNLSMFEVEKISRDIAQLNPNAKIIFGISKDAKLKNKIKATLLMTGPGNGSAPVREPEVKPTEVKTVVKEKAEIKKEVIKPPVKEVIKKEDKDMDKPEKKKNKRPTVKKRSAGKKQKTEKKTAVTSIPIFNKNPEQEAVTVCERKFSEIDELTDSGKKTIRRNALEIKKAMEADEQKKQLQEKEWEIPAFLRRVKFKN